MGRPSGPARALCGAAIVAAALLPLPCAARLARLHGQCQATERSAGLPCREPVGRAPVKLPEYLVLGDHAQNFEMHSGYVNVTAEDFLFYWLVEAEAPVARDAPLIVWSNGGPGCSSMEGATLETGPFIMFDLKQSSSMFSRRLSKNTYSWNRFAHVLYVDQPRYVGFSCGTGPRVSSSADAGRDMVQFLRGWHNLFPEHARRDLILASESYGGHYVPAWTEAILDFNAHARDPLPLKGISIGNGIINETVQGSGSFVKYQKLHRLIPQEAEPTSDIEARLLMAANLGYVPNVYDYRLQEQECCGCAAYNYKTWGDWMLMEDVTRALNVCGHAGVKAFAACNAGCIDMSGFDKGDALASPGALGRALEAGIPVTLYYGKQDTACDYIGGFLAASQLRWRGAEDFAGAPLEDLMHSDAVAGQMKRAAGLTFIQVDGAGHMVPVDSPAAASFAVGTLFSWGRSESVASLYT